MRAKHLLRLGARFAVVLGLILARPVWAQETPGVRVPSPYNPSVIPVPVPVPVPVPIPIPIPPPMLGVNVDAAPVWSGIGWESGVRVLSVWPGYPAAGRLDPGDIIIRINGYRTRTLYDFRYAMSLAGPMVNLRVRDVFTGQIFDMPPIYLNGVIGGGAPFGAPMPAPSPLGRGVP